MTNLIVQGNVCDLSIHSMRPQQQTQQPQNHHNCTHNTTHSHGWRQRGKEKHRHTHTHTLPLSLPTTHTHAHSSIYMYIYVYMHVCICIGISHVHTQTKGRTTTTHTQERVRWAPPAVPCDWTKWMSCKMPPTVSFCFLCACACVCVCVCVCVSWAPVAVFAVGCRCPHHCCVLCHPSSRCFLPLCICFSCLWGRLRVCCVTCMVVPNACACVCVPVCVYMYVCDCMIVCVCVCVCVRMYVYVRMLYAYGCMFVCRLCVHTYIFICVCEGMDRFESVLSSSHFGVLGSCAGVLCGCSCDHLHTCC